ncbi:uncharacterized protein LOC133792059 [Humulus lupulus]|uniref:uncharacterized protein LOC133792059 n=1 Tax=Humulus lupulus TaxID=3486 RepID=UPI002B405367|nr:uncharacterized protein LOC133792059 [Humulus lupulus]
MSWYIKKILRLRFFMDEDSLMLAVKGGKFHSKLFYFSLVAANSVGFTKTVWNKLIMPKHRFIYWQIFNSQLLTRDHLCRYIQLTSVLCPVCDSGVETHSHLFMECIYSRRVYEEIGRWLGVFHWPESYEELSNWCLLANHSLQNQIINAVIAASWYFIWCNKNSCIFESSCKMARSLSLEVKEVVKYRVLSWGYFSLHKKDVYFRQIVERW